MSVSWLSEKVLDKALAAFPHREYLNARWVFQNVCPHCVCEEWDIDEDHMRILVLGTPEEINKAEMLFAFAFESDAQRFRDEIALLMETDGKA